MLKYIDPGSICKDDTPSSPPQNQETASTANVTGISTEEETAGAISIPRADANISLPSNLPSSPPSPGQEIAYSASDIAPQETANISSIIGPQTAEQISVHSEEDTFNDPSNWPTTVTQGPRDILIERGPYQVKGIDFPRDSAHRNVHYRRTLTNGERLEKPWLVYSVSKDVTFCFCCKPTFFVEARENQLLEEMVLKTGRICQASLVTIKNQLNILKVFINGKSWT